VSRSATSACRGRSRARPATIPTHAAWPDFDWSLKGNRVYFGYGTNKGGVLQIVDRDKLLNGPKEPTPENLRYPEVGKLDDVGLERRPHGVPDAGDADRRIRQGQGRQETRHRHHRRRADPPECQEARQMVWFADITVEKTPTIVSTFQVPEASGQFLQPRRPLRHAFLQREHGAGLLQAHDVLRLFQRRRARRRRARPYTPRRSPTTFPAITEATDKRCVKVDGKESCKIAIQTNNVETDDRGYIYIVDRANTGMHILELTGDARKAALAQLSQLGEKSEQYQRRHSGSFHYIALVGRRAMFSGAVIRGGFCGGRSSLSWRVRSFWSAVSSV
jgi:hypothetical protein